MLTNPALAAILRHLADEIEKVDAPPAPSPPVAPAPASTSVQYDPALIAPVLAPSPAPASQAPPPTQPAPPAPAAPVQPKPVIDLTTIKGVQQALNQIRTVNFPKLEENGLHDAVMAWDLKYFQASTGIPVTGEIDEITLNTIHKAIFGTPRT